MKDIDKMIDEVIKRLEEESLRMYAGELHNGWKFKFSITQTKFKRRIRNG